MTKILIVEDDRSLQDALAYNLRREGFTPVQARDAASALELARREQPDLVLLDLMLPDRSGLDVCREIRSFSLVPILIITARDDESDRVVGLEMGADDYVVKPFSLRELLARIRANLRRVQLDREPDHDVLEHGRLRVEVPERRAGVDGTVIAFQPREFDLLVYFMRHPGRVLSRERLLAGVWGHDFVGVRTVDVHVRRIRAKLEQAGGWTPERSLIQTVHGVGYVFGRE